MSPKVSSQACSRTDHDITDDAAGRARLDLAASSKAKKVAEAAELAERNAAIRERIASQQSRSDASLEDEDDTKVNERRKQLAAESEARRATEAMQLLSLIHI